MLLTYGVKTEKLALVVQISVFKMNKRVSKEAKNTAESKCLTYKKRKPSKA